MPLRVGFDMDGVLADFASAYAAVARRLFGDDAASATTVPETAPEAQADAAEGQEPLPPHPLLLSKRQLARRQAMLVWQHIRTTADFWATLAPTDPAAILRLQGLSIRHGWEVAFLTQRPATAGEPVQRQTQRWLVEYGVELPSVFVVSQSRGIVAKALSLDILVDDRPENCLDIVSDSRARAILIWPEDEDALPWDHASLGIGVVRSFAECLDVLERVEAAAAKEPGLMERISRTIGWKS